MKKTTYVHGPTGRATGCLYWAYWYLSGIDAMLGRNPQGFRLSVTYHG